MLVNESYLLSVRVLMTKKIKEVFDLPSGVSIWLMGIPTSKQK